jgi:hypothetical protein
MSTECNKLDSCLPTYALSSPTHSCFAATAGLTADTSSTPFYQVTTNAQLLGLSKCTSIDYLWIFNCADCTQVAWCGLQLQSISGKDPSYGYTLYLGSTSGISDMCGVKNLKGALTGGVLVEGMGGLVSLDGAEGITSVGLSSVANSIYLANNPILTSAIALANTEYPADTLIIKSNTILKCVPSAWPATDKEGSTIIHGSCPTTTAPTPAPALGGGGSSSSSASTGMIVGIVIAIVALACAAGFLFYRKRRSPGGRNPLVQKTTKDVEMGAVEVDLPAGLPLHSVGTAQFDPDEGFPINDSARALCATQWKAHRDFNSSFAGDAAEQHTTKVQYADLQAATRNFGDSHKIGDGGSCIVYKAELYGVLCAIKLLSQDASAWEEKQFAAEINVLTHVKHENICQLYACSTDGPNRCLVLELMDTSLEGRAHVHPSLGWEQRTYILVCICRGLVHLHNESPPLIHRDMKSDNGTCMCKPMLACILLSRKYVCAYMLRIPIPIPIVRSASFRLQDQLPRQSITGEDR